MADGSTSTGYEQTAGSFLVEEANGSPSRLQDVAMKFLVHSGGEFGGGINGYRGGRVGSMTFMEPNGVDWFVMLDNLAHHGYRGNASLYYLKPDHVLPNGLVLLEGLAEFNRMMKDHEGKKVCNLYIVKEPKMRWKVQHPDMFDYDNSSDSGDDNEEGYAWEGEEEDDQLYEKNATIDSTQKQSKSVQPSQQSSGANHSSTNISADPIEDDHSPLNSDDDETVYVHRSVGVDCIRFDESTMRHPVMLPNMVFTCVKQFREALKNLIIDEGRQVTRPKNDHLKVSAKCEAVDCPWYIYASRLPNGCEFKIKKFVEHHTCGKSHTVKQMDAKWIGNEYEDFFRSEKDWRVKSLKDAVLRDTQVGISRSKAYRAKRHALQKIGGDYTEQYHRLQDYAHTVLAVNPSSFLVIKCFVDPTQTINPRFERMYVSFDAQIKGFLAGCRPFIGLDGTHVKLPNGGQILTAQGRDANNNLFPIAFALVESENGSSWTWFLELLVNSIGHGEHCGGWTIMSDRQKGLKDAVKIMFPQAEHRYCLRHLYANFKNAGFRGPRLKQLMDNAAYAYKEFDFLQAMDEIKKENTNAWKWLSQIDSKHWSRHRFSPNAKTDLVVNNISESYNVWILEAREEPVCTMVEHIRTKLMESISNKRQGAEEDTWVIAPNYQKRLELEKKSASYCWAVCAGHGIWQVTCGERQYMVDLSNKKCGCYKWDVTGVPCQHAVCAIHKFKHKPEDYMSSFFTKEKYIAAYERMIMPVPDKTQWIKTDLPDIDPPLYHAQPGRPKKKRIRAQGEPHVEARASKKATIKCSNCNTYGHNVKGCGMPIRADWQPRKGGKHNRASTGVPPVSCTEPNGSHSQTTSTYQHDISMMETHLVPFDDPIFVNNDQRVSVDEGIEGGPRKMIPIRKRTS